MLDQVAITSYTGFVEDVEPRLKHALSAALGPDRGLEAAAEALSYGWEHWDRIRSMDNPAGYLYRVGYRSGLKR
jgi:RNA polymerase sigma-70 factor (ECF subfamily)